MSGLKFLGEPLRSGAQMGVNSLQSTANVGQALWNGDPDGAVNEWRDGIGKQARTLVQLPGRQLDDLFGQ